MLGRRRVSLEDGRNVVELQVPSIGFKMLPLHLQQIDPTHGEYAKRTDSFDISLSSRSHIISSEPPLNRIWKTSGFKSHPNPEFSSEMHFSNTFLLLGVVASRTVLLTSEVVLFRCIVPTHEPACCHYDTAGFLIKGGCKYHNPPTSHFSYRRPRANIGLGTPALPSSALTVGYCTEGTDGAKAICCFKVGFLLSPSPTSRSRSRKLVY